MYYKTMEAHGAYPGLPSSAIEVGIVKSVAVKDREPSGDMAEQVENIKRTDSTIGLEAVDQASAIDSASEAPKTVSSLEDLLSSMSPEDREKAESIFSEMGAPVVAREVEIVDSEPAVLFDSPAPVEHPSMVDPVSTEVASGVIVTADHSTRPEAAVTVGRLDTLLAERVDAAAKKHIDSDKHRARELRDARRDERENARQVAEQGINKGFDDLYNAKNARNSTRLEHNRFTQSLRAAELKGQYQRQVQERIEKGDLAGKTRRAQKAYMKGAKELAKKDARTERVDARKSANEKVVTARADIARNRAVRRDNSLWNRKGGRNTYFENKRIVGGGFSLGEISGSGLTDEQKKKLEERRRSAYAGKSRGSAHQVRGRSSTRSHVRPK